MLCAGSKAGGSKVPGFVGRFDFSNEFFCRWFFENLRQNLADDGAISKGADNTYIVDQAALLKAAGKKFGDEFLTTEQKSYLLHELRGKRLEFSEEGKLLSVSERSGRSWMARGLDDFIKPLDRDLAGKVLRFFSSTTGKLGTEEEKLEKLLRDIPPGEMGLFKRLVERDLRAEGRSFDEILEAELSSRELGRIRGIVATAGEGSREEYLARAYALKKDRLTAALSRLAARARRETDRAGLRAEAESLRREYAGALRGFTGLGLTEAELERMPLEVMPVLMAAKRTEATREKMEDIARAHDIGEFNLDTRVIEAMRQKQDRSAYDRALASFHRELGRFTAAAKSGERPGVRCLNSAMAAVQRELDIFAAQEAEGMRALEENLETCVTTAKTVVVASLAMTFGFLTGGIPGVLVGIFAGTGTGLIVNVIEYAERGRSLKDHVGEIFLESLTEAASSSLSLGIGGLAARVGAKLVFMGAALEKGGRAAGVVGRAVQVVAKSDVARQIVTNEAIAHANVVLRGSYDDYTKWDAIVSGASGLVGGGLIDRYTRGKANLAAEVGREFLENVAETGAERGDVTTADAIGGVGGALTELGGSVGRHMGGAARASGGGHGRAGRALHAPSAGGRSGDIQRAGTEGAIVIEERTDKPGSEELLPARDPAAQKLESSAGGRRVGFVISPGDTRARPAKSADGTREGCCEDGQYYVRDRGPDGSFGEWHRLGGLPGSPRRPRSKRPASPLAQHARNGRPSASRKVRPKGWAVRQDAAARPDAVPARKLHALTPPGDTHPVEKGDISDESPDPLTNPPPRLLRIGSRAVARGSAVLFDGREVEELDFNNRLYQRLNVGDGIVWLFRRGHGKREDRRAHVAIVRNRSGVRIERGGKEIAVSKGQRAELQDGDVLVADGKRQTFYSPEYVESALLEKLVGEGWDVEEIGDDGVALSEPAIAVEEGDIVEESPDPAVLAAAFGKAAKAVPIPEESTTRVQEKRPAAAFHRPKTPPESGADPSLAFVVAEDFGVQRRSSEGVPARLQRVIADGEVTEGERAEARAHQLIDEGWEVVEVSDAEIRLAPPLYEVDEETPEKPPARKEGPSSPVLEALEDLKRGEHERQRREEEAFAEEQRRAEAAAGAHRAREDAILRALGDLREAERNREALAEAQRIAEEREKRVEAERREARRRAKVEEALGRADEIRQQGEDVARRIADAEAAAARAARRAVLDGAARSAAAAREAAREAVLRRQLDELRGMAREREREEERVAKEAAVAEGERRRRLGDLLRGIAGSRAEAETKLAEQKARRNIASRENTALPPRLSAVGAIHDSHAAEFGRALGDEPAPPIPAERRPLADRIGSAVVLRGLLKGQGGSAQAFFRRIGALTGADVVATDIKQGIAEVARRARADVRFSSFLVPGMTEQEVAYEYFRFLNLRAQVERADGEAFENLLRS